MAEMQAALRYLSISYRVLLPLSETRRKTSAVRPGHSRFWHLVTTSRVCGRRNHQGTTQLKVYIILLSLIYAILRAQFLRLVLKSGGKRENLLMNISKSFAFS